MEQIELYPHMDKMWLKYYDKSFLKQELPKMNICDYMKSKSSNYINNTAMTYYGRKISYGEFYENIDNAARVLVSMGVKKDDRILCLMPNIPETAYIMYAASLLGAVVDFVDPRPDSVDLKTSALKILSTFIKEKSKYIVTLDQCYVGMLSLIENELKEHGIKNILLVSPSNSMDLKSTINYLEEMVIFNGIKSLKLKLKAMRMVKERLEKLKETSSLELLDYEILSKINSYTKFTNIGYIPNQLTTILHTSGTTSSIPKPIPLTNDNMNAYVHQTFGANMPMTPSDKALHILPYFAAFGANGVAHAGFCHANNLYQIPEFSSVNFGKLILRYKPQIIIGPPTWLLNLLNDKSLTNKDLSFIKMITYGGGSLDIKYEKELNKFLKNHNSESVITKGHGLSELCGCSSYAIGEYNVLGSIGIPLPNTIYAIINPESKELIPFKNEDKEIEGEVIVSSPSATSGILDGEIITQHYIYDGLDFIDTKDIAKMDRNGIMTFLTRSDRTFTRYDGYKYKPYEIENIIKQHALIKDCIITSYFDDKKMGNMPLATIITIKELTSKEKLDLVRQIIDKYFIYNKDVSSRQIPSKIVFMNHEPLTINDKINYKALIKEHLDGSEFTIAFDETNISIGNIEIIPPKEKIKSLHSKVN